MQGCGFKGNLVTITSRLIDHVESLLLFHGPLCILEQSDWEDNGGKKIRFQDAIIMSTNIAVLLRSLTHT